MPEVSDVLKATDGEEVSDVPVGDDRQPFYAFANRAALTRRHEGESHRVRH